MSNYINFIRTSEAGAYVTTHKKLRREVLCMKLKRMVEHFFGFNR